MADHSDAPLPPLSDLQQNPLLRERAYQKLYENPMILHTIRQWSKDFGLKGLMPEDVLQEAIIALDEILSAGQFRGDSTLTTFFLSICKNLVRSGARRVHRIDFKEGITDADWRDPDIVADSLILQEETAAEEQRRVTMLESLKNLTENCRKALQQYYWDALNMKQIALFRLRQKGYTGEVDEDTLAAEAKQAKKIVHRCRETLRSLVQ